MASQIDPNVPIEGSPTTASVRSNFSIAKTEITTLQTTMLPLTGGTLTGVLTLASEPASKNDAATKNYVDTHTAAAGAVSSWNARTGAVVMTPTDVSTAGGLMTTGGTMTGALTLKGAPAADNEASTKKYVDDKVTGSVAGVASFNGRTGAVALSNTDVGNANGLLVTGGTMIGDIVLKGDPAAALNPATKQYVDSKSSGGIADAPNDGLQYGRQSLGWTVVVAPPLPATVAPLSDAGSAAVGTSTLYARQDHVHPTDVSRAPLINPTFTAGLFEKQVALGAGTSIDLTTGSVFSKTITGPTSLTIAGVPAASTVVSFILDLTNGGVGAVTWWPNMKWPGGTAPTLTAAGRDVLGFMTYDGGATWSGFMMGKGMA